MENPDFGMFRGPLDGFQEEKARKDGYVKPSQENIRALGDFITPDAEMVEFHELTNWHTVVRHMYQRLGWFRQYYCGEDLPDVVYDGGMNHPAHEKGDNLLTENVWHLEAKRLKKFADG